MRASPNPLLGQGSLEKTILQRDAVWIHDSLSFYSDMIKFVTITPMSKRFKSLKQEITSMVSITHKDDQIVESKEITPISSPKNTYDTNSDELNDTNEEELLLHGCRLEDVPERWSCNDCVEYNAKIGLQVSYNFSAHPHDSAANQVGGGKLHYLILRRLQMIRTRFCVFSEISSVSEIVLIVESGILMR
ncbi:hypothetical protein YC2023_040382 [Brassica napus]